MTDAPRYAHVCDKCRFLGSFRAHDLYFCKTPEGLPHVIARYGDAVHEYISSHGPPNDPILAHAHYLVEMGEEIEWIGVPALSTDETMAWGRLLSEMVGALTHAQARAEVWKRTAKRIWTRWGPDRSGRWGFAARDVKMLRHGR